VNVGAFGEHGVEMRGENEIRMRRCAGAHTNHVAYFIDADIFEPRLEKQALEFLAANLFVKWRRGNFADTNLLINEMGFVTLGGVERDFHGGIVDEPGGVLRERGSGKREKRNYGVKTHQKERITMSTELQDRVGDYYWGALGTQIDVTIDSTTSLC
jgi:hypothetical protein